MAQTDRQTDRQTDGNRDSMTDPGQWGRVSEKNNLYIEGRQVIGTASSVDHGPSTLLQCTNVDKLFFFLFLDIFVLVLVFSQGKIVKANVILTVGRIQS